MKMTMFDEIILFKINFMNLVVRVNLGKARFEKSSLIGDECTQYS